MLVVVAVLALLMLNYRALVGLWLWLMASVKFSVPFAALAAIGSSFACPAGRPAGVSAFLAPVTAVTEPFGQVDLRDAVRDALAAWTPDARPDRLRDPRTTVFQYLGTMDRPAQIAFTGLATQVAFDFRTGLAHTAGGSWRRVTDLGPQDTSAVVGLIRFWERMKLARSRSSR